MKFLVIFSNFLSFTFAAKILAIFQLPFFSHHLVYEKIVQELLSRGHELTVFGCFEMAPHSNLTQHIFENSVKIFAKYPNIIELKAKEVSFLYQTIFHYFPSYFQQTIDQVQHLEIQRLFNEKFEFDLMLMECVYCQFEVLADIFDCPIVRLFATDAPSFVHWEFGNEVNPLQLSDIILPYVPGHLTFFEKVHSLVVFIYCNFVYSPPVNLINWIIDQVYLPNVEGIEHSKRQVLLLTNTDPVFGYKRRLSNSTKQIGFISVEPPKKLPENELKSFLDNSPDGVVIICFGTAAVTRNLNGKIEQIFLKAFEELPKYNFVLKLDEKVENSLKNLKIVEWLPLADVLAHKNVKLFIFHCGHNSAFEAIDREVPMIGFPFAYDQPANARMLVHNGIALELDINTVTVDELRNSIVKAIEEGTLKKNLQTMKKVLEDRPKKPLEVAVSSIEEVLKGKYTFEKRENYCWLFFKSTAVVFGVIFLMRFFIVRS